MKRCYIAIDLKSFYASVECVERGLDPIDTCLVVADKSRTDKTICLAVSPALKTYGIGGRPRLFEVVQNVRKANISRGNLGRSFSKQVLDSHPELAIDYIVAPPRMSLYIDYSTRIYEVYLKYISHTDIHTYSIDEVIIDATSYLDTYHMTAYDLVKIMLRDVLATTGVTATAGIGENMYLCKVAMDIVAKHMHPDDDGFRIADLDEMSYRRMLWGHKPLTDFWRVGRGVSERLEKIGIYTMGDIARCSVENEDLLYNLFGVNAELIIDHAWGWEPVTMQQVKNYRPKSSSLSSGQVLTKPYSVKKARIVIMEMADSLALSLVEKGLETNEIVITIGYDRENLTNETIRVRYKGKKRIDHYGRTVPVHSRGTSNLQNHTSSSRIISDCIGKLFDNIVNPILLVRKLNITANNLVSVSWFKHSPKTTQLNLFADYNILRYNNELGIIPVVREHQRQKTIIFIKERYGKNTILKGLDFYNGATQRDRNSQIGGHHE